MPIYLYSLENYESSSIQAQLLYATYSKFDHDWPSLLHSHPFIELSYIKNGLGKFIIEDQEYPVKKGDIVIVNSNVAHTEMSEINSPLEYYIIGVEGINFSPTTHTKHLIFNPKQDSKDFLFYISSLFHEMEQKQPDYARICQNLLEVLIVKIIRYTHLSVEAAESSPAAKSNQECIRVKNYIDSNYAQDISLDTLSELSHLNKYYLIHTFKKQYGCSPITHLCNVRLQISKELLSTTDLSISAIAQSSGFSSVSYFSQCFQKHYGLPPSAYRKQLKMDEDERPMICSLPGR